jgi:hypothetical protein
MIGHEAQSRAIFAYYCTVAEGARPVPSESERLRARLIVSAGYDFFLQYEQVVAVIKKDATAG